MHLRGSRQPFEVLATGFHADSSDKHTVQVYNLQLNAFRCFLKQDIFTSVVFMGISMFVENGSYPPYLTQNFLFIVKLPPEQVVIDIRTC